MKTTFQQSPIAGCMRWGQWGAQFSTQEYRSMIENCLEVGINRFDHADIYGDYTTEEAFGNALSENTSLREQIQIITKCGIQLVSPNRLSHSIKSYNTSKQHIINSVNRSLENFNTHYLDVLLIHRPDPLLEPDEIAAAVDELKQAGKIIAFGVSNFSTAQINLLALSTEIEYHQFEFSILQMKALKDGSLENAMSKKIIPMAWAPLGGGIFNDESHPRFRAISKTAEELAEKYVTGVNEILLAWIHTHPANIQTVVGTTKMERLIQARNAAHIKLDREDWFQLLLAATGEEVA